MADAKKAALLRMLWGLLEPGGQILVGDISFRTRCERVACREKNRGIWDSSEYYFTVEEFFRRLKGLPCTYEAIPPCAGILTIARKP